MTWIVILIGLGGAAMIALGLDVWLPLGGAVSAILDLVGVALVVHFVALMDGI
jgi:hypothetical protein